MSRSLISPLTIFLSLAAIQSYAIEPASVKGHLLVRIDPHQSIKALAGTAAKVGAKNIKSFSLVKGLNLYKLNDNTDFLTAQRAFQNNSAVLYAEPDYIYHTFVNDPSYVKQWALENKGQTGGKADSDINAEKTWELQKGNPDVVIGIIDTGVDYTHPDLVANMWHNPGEIADNLKDDDQNGYVDDIYGINSIANSGNPMDDNMHGTHVAGTIAATGDNNIGVIGVAPNARVASCKFLSSEGSGGISDAIKCMEYFAQLKSRNINPVNIVATNNSWGGGAASQALLDAIKEHEALGILFIAAAGNESNNNDINDRYPCNYNVENVISVAASDHDDNLASFSNYGKKTVHVAAPGLKILSTVLNHGYAELSGTSMATPHVSGLAALVASHFPNLNYAGIKNLITTGGQKILAASTTTISGRRIRGADELGIGSLTCDNQILNIRQSPKSSTQNINFGASILLSAWRINCANPAGPITVYDSDGLKLMLDDQGQNGDVKAKDGIYSLVWQPNQTGSYALNFGDNDIVTINVSENNAFRAYKADNLVAYEYDIIDGLRLGATDESVHAIISPFPIHFGGDRAGFTNLYVSANGTISFSDASKQGFDNLHLPHSLASSLVAPFWDDLVAAKSGSDIYWDVLGSAPNRRMVIEWFDFRHYRSKGTGTFQVVFYENSPDIRFNYYDTLFNNTLYDYGRSATVGVQSDAEHATEYSFKATRIRSGTSILWSLE